MKMKSDQFSFKTIYVSENDNIPEDIELPEKKPFIILTAIKDSINILKDFPLIQFGTYRIDSKNQYILTITGERKIREAIELIIQHTSDNSLHKQLEHFKKSSEDTIDSNQPPVKKQVPKQAVPYQDLSFIENKLLDEENRGYQAYYEVIYNNEHYIYKPSTSGRQGSELEAFNSLCYDILIGEQSAPVLSVYDNKNNRRLGIISKKIDGYFPMDNLISRYWDWVNCNDNEIPPLEQCSSLRNCIYYFTGKTLTYYDCSLRTYTEIMLRPGWLEKLNENRYDEEKIRHIVNRQQGEAFFYHEHVDTYVPNQAEIFDVGLEKILAAAYCEEENDLHGTNIGYNSARNKVFKIDHGQATFPLTAKYFGIDPQFDRGYYKKPVNAFPVTQPDIENFPYLKSARPNNFYNTTGSSWVNNHAENNPFKELNKNFQFQQGSHDVFFKRILLPESFYQHAADLTLSSEKTKNKTVESKTLRSSQLKQALVLNQNFATYVVKGGQEKFEKAIKDFKQFRHFDINFNEIEMLYNEIKRYCTTTLFIYKNIRYDYLSLDENIDNKIDSIKNKANQEFSLSSKEQTFMKPIYDHIYNKQQAWLKIYDKCITNSYTYSLISIEEALKYECKKLTKFFSPDEINIIKIKLVIAGIEKTRSEHEQLQQKQLQQKQLEQEQLEQEQLEQEQLEQERIEQEPLKEESMQQNKIKILTIIDTLIHNIEAGANGRWTSDKNSPKVTLFKNLINKVNMDTDFALKNYYHQMLDICNQHRNYLCFWEPHSVMEFKQLINENFNLKMEGINTEKSSDISNDSYQGHKN